MKRGMAAAALIVAAVLVQTAVLDRLPLPWGVAPDLVALVVIAVALRGTAATGAIAGCFGGLAVDILPPADHEIGRYAMVLCLVGYAVGAVRDNTARTGLRPFGIAALALLAVGLGFAFVGMVLGDPRITPGSVLLTIPLTLAMSMVISPFVFYPVFAVLDRLAGDEFAAIGDAPWLNRGMTR